MTTNFTKRYRVKDPSKYEGDPRRVIARSKWEFWVFNWLDTNTTVKSWSSEEIIVPYVCKTDGKIHRYFVDVKFKTKTGKIFLIEIKPSYQISPPVKKPNQREKTYIRECLRFAKNTSKWEAAKKYCKKRGWIFQIWDERVLHTLGIGGIKPMKTQAKLPKLPRKSPKKRK